MSQEQFAHMMNEVDKPPTQPTTPLINQEHTSIVGECQTESVIIKEELHAVCERLGGNIEPKEEYLSDELEPENQHSESDSEDDKPLTEFKIEVVEHEVSRNLPNQQDVITEEQKKNEQSDTNVIRTTMELTDLEDRVLNVIGVQAATGMHKQEAGFVQGVGVGVEEDSLSGLQVPATETVDELTVDDVPYEYTPISEDEWNTPGTSSQPTVAPPVPPPTPQPPALTPPPAPVQSQWQPQKKKKKPEAEDTVLKIFKECEGNAREYEKERDRIAQELERERIRQRDIELQLQAQWLEFMKEALQLLKAYFEKRSE